MKKIEAIDYKKELEAASKTMILIHHPETLIKLIVRMFVNKVNIKHAAILLYDNKKNTYVLTVSRGAHGLKIPTGFARMDCDNPLISFFVQRRDKEILDDGILELNYLRRLIKNKKLSPKVTDNLKKIAYQMEIFDVVACVPSFFRDTMLGLLLLGEREDNTPFKKSELDFFSALASDVAMAIRNAQLFEELEEELEKRRHLFIHTTIALAAAIDAKDPYTHGHTARVTNYSLALSDSLKRQLKLDDKFRENLHISSLLHDIGKIGIPERVLHKVSRLTDEERKIIQQHPVIGVNIVQPIKELKDCLDGIKYHHERYDGKGYPEGLKGRQIPLSAAIISVADAFDAINSNRPYRKGLCFKDALCELTRCSGTQFNPLVVKAAKTALHGQS